MRLSAKLALVICVAIFVGATYRLEYSSRYHLDSLREERATTTRVLGFPIWSTDRAPYDPYAGIYAKITGRSPDPSRWKQMRPDYILSPWGGMYHCFGFSLEFRERRQLLGVLYERYGATESQPDAIAQLRRIDELAPIPSPTERELDYAAVDALRKELGLKPHLNP